MKNTILTEDDYLQFYKAILYGKIDDVVFSSVKASYKDWLTGEEATIPTIPHILWFLLFKINL